MAKETTALEVIVDQKPGIINWNFEQLKTALAEKMKEYEGLVYTEETVPVAKADIATLRKLKKSVSDKRIEIKKKCLEPYEVIEKQAEELTKLLDKPITEIANQLDDYEKQRKETVRKEIQEYMTKKFEELPEYISVKLKTFVYDDRWENATTSKKTWKDAIEKELERVKGDIKVIEDVEEEFREDAVAVYGLNLVLSEAMSKVMDLRKQKEKILERERERIAEEERKKAEKAVVIPMKGLSDGRMEDSEQDEDYIEVEDYIDAMEALDGKDEVEKVVEKITPPKQENKIYVLRISATPTQIAMIKGYIEHAGAVYREEN